MKHRSRVAALALALTLCACSESPAIDDGGPDAVDAGPDAALRDAGRDAGPDAQVPPLDSGLHVDAGEGDSGTDGGPADAGPDDAGPPDAGPDDAGPPDAGPPDSGPPDAGPPDAGGPLVFDVRVLADSFCDELRFEPASITVPTGTEFKVRWINATGCTEIDVNAFGTVSIVIGLEPGQSHYDAVRSWCGPGAPATFTFRAYYSDTYQFYLPVNCRG